jgi:hypothetical protein
MTIKTGDLVELRNPFKVRDTVGGVEIEYLIDPKVRIGVILSTGNTDCVGNLLFDILLEGDVKKSLSTAFWDVKKID